jgi:hypothetical protein
MPFNHSISFSSNHYQESNPERTNIKSREFADRTFLSNQELQEMIHQGYQAYSNISSTKVICNNTGSLQKKGKQYLPTIICATANVSNLEV